MCNLEKDQHKDIYFTGNILVDDLSLPISIFSVFLLLKNVEYIAGRCKVGFFTAITLPGQKAEKTYSIKNLHVNVLFFENDLPTFLKCYPVEYDQCLPPCWSLPLNI